MNQSNYNLIREKCIAANPEIVELKFGCEVILREPFDFEDQPLITRTKIIDRVNRDYYCDGGRTIAIIKEGGFKEILGRSIRLADLVYAIKKAWWKKESSQGLDRAFLQLIFFYDLRHDDLNQQSDETINFLYELLLG